LLSPWSWICFSPTAEQSEPLTCPGLIEIEIDGIG